jgi:hypothetical protein
VAEHRVTGLQHLLAQNAAMGVEEGEGGVVSDEADVVDVVGDPLEFGHQRPQPDRPPWRLTARGGLDGAREGNLVGDGAVA